MASVILPLAKGFEELEAVGLIDVMRRAGIKVTVAYLKSSGHGKIVKGDNGIGIQANCSLDDIIVDDFDMLILPGGWDGTYALADDDRVIKLVQEFKAHKIVGAMCAAPFVLKKAGVLGDNYTCYPDAKDEINHAGYRDDLKVVEDGNIITSQGPGTAVCFALAIVKKLVDEETMQNVKDGMLLDYC